jgi:uncharacterized membrane protein YgcG
MSSNNDQSSKIYYTSKYGAIKKLDGTNYIEWKGDISAILSVMNALQIVQGEEPEPPASNTAAGRTITTEYAKRRALATTAIRFSCTQAIAICIRNETDPAVMWNILQKKFDATSSFVGRNAIATKFQRARPEKDEAMSIYISRLQAYRAELQGTSQEISEENLLGHIYSTCPPKFKTIVTVLKRTPDMTIEALEAGLKEAEEELKAEDISDAVVDSKSATGLYAQGRGGRGGYRGRGGRGGKGGRGGRGGRGGKGTKNRSCTYCKMDNHTTQDCWKRQKEQNQQHQQSRKHARNADNDEEVICYHCGESGHMRNECELKKRVDEIRRQRNGKGKGRALLAIEDKPSSSNQVEEMYENQQ